MMTECPCRKFRRGWMFGAVGWHDLGGMAMRLRTGLAAAIGLTLAAGPADAAEPPAANRTRTELLKQKVAGEYRGQPLRQVLKALANEVEEQAGKRVMWTYLDGVDSRQPVTAAGKGRALDVVLSEVLTAAGLEAVVIDEDDHPRAGWVWVVTPAEAKAYKEFRGAVEAVREGQPDDAKLLLAAVVKKHPETKTRAKAEALLEKLNK